MAANTTAPVASFAAFVAWADEVVADRKAAVAREDERQARMSDLGAEVGLSFADILADAATAWH